MDPSDQIKSRQLLVSRAFEGACEQLGIGLGSLNVWRRERVAKIAAACAAGGDVRQETLQARIVDHYLREWPTKPTSGSGPKQPSTIA
jgi:hypothetical protein